MGIVMIAKDYKPKYTVWRDSAVRKVAVAHKRYCRRMMKMYLRTGNPRDLDRANRKLTTWDFD